MHKVGDKSFFTFFAPLVKPAGYVAGKHKCNHEDGDVEHEYDHELDEAFTFGESFKDEVCQLTAVQSRLLLKLCFRYSPTPSITLCTIKVAGRMTARRMRTLEIKATSAFFTQLARSNSRFTIQLVSLFLIKMESPCNDSECLGVSVVHGMRSLAKVHIDSVHRTLSSLRKYVVCAYCQD
jgi:hypothetical protein